MARLKYEFPTEWSLGPDVSQDDWDRSPLENNPNNPKAPELKPVDSPLEPRALAAGASGSSPQ
jgi:hypothetical protein